MNAHIVEARKEMGRISLELNRKFRFLVQKMDDHKTEMRISVTGVRNVREEIIAEMSTDQICCSECDRM